MAARRSLVKRVYKGCIKKTARKGLWVESWGVGPEAADDQGSWIFGKQSQC